MQHPFGIARISYPRGISRSSADPATTMALPASLARLPGIVSRPIRLGDEDFFSGTADFLTRAGQIFRIADPKTPITATTYPLGTLPGAYPYPYYNAATGQYYNPSSGSFALVSSNWLPWLVGLGVVVVFVGLMRRG